MSSVLTPGCLSAIVNGENFQNPIVQILGIKKISADKTERFRLMLNDSKEQYTSAMLATQLNEMINSGKIEQNTVVKVNQYTTNQMSSKIVIILLNVTVLKTAAETGGCIGNPVPLQGPSAASNNSSAATPANVMKLSDNNNQQANNAAAVSKNVFPIVSLSPYQNRWTIKARVTNKSDIRTWSNSKGEGKLFSVDLLDESAEMRATAFNEQVDQFYDLMQVNKVYYITKATVKNANKQFSSINNEYEMAFHSGTEVTPCDDNADDVPTFQFDFVPINNLENLSKDSIVDVLGVCKSASDLQSVVSRTTSKELQKRDIQLVDKSNTEITFTLWGDRAVKFDGSTNPVVAVKGARLSEYNGRSLSAMHSSVIHINPDVKEAFALRGWYDSEGMNANIQSITNKGGGMMGSTNWKYFWEVKNENLGTGEKPDYYTVAATVTLIKHENALYKACANQDCMKKVIDMNNGMYRCEKCNQESANFKWRLLLQCVLSDYNASEWVTFFQEAAETIIGLSAEEVGALKESSERNSDSKYLNRMTSRCFKEYIFKLRVKMETFNGESRLKTICVSVKPIDPVEYGNKLIKDLREMGINV